MISKETIYGVVKSINNTNLDVNGNVNVICEDTVLKDLEVLEILKKHLFIKIFDNKPAFDDLYRVILQEDEQDLNYTSIFVNEEEKEKISHWLKNWENTHYVETKKSSKDKYQSLKDTDQNIEPDIGW